MYLRQLNILIKNNKEGFHEILQIKKTSFYIILDTEIGSKLIVLNGRFLC